MASDDPTQPAGAQGAGADIPDERGELAEMIARNHRELLAAIADSGRDVPAVFAASQKEFMLDMTRMQIEFLERHAREARPVRNRFEKWMSRIAGAVVGSAVTLLVVAASVGYAFGLAAALVSFGEFLR